MIWEGAVISTWLHTEKKERSVSKVVVQVCSGGWGKLAQANTARKTLPLPSKHLIQCLEGTKKERVLGEDLGFGGEVKAQNAQGRCRGMGRDMVQVGSKFGARRNPVVSQVGSRKVMVTKREKWERLTRAKKTTKTKKTRWQKKNEFFFWDKTGFDLLASP
jgi:hypothetical protein